jgi:chemotaxis protein methyltransferase CheR
MQPDPISPGETWSWDALRQWVETETGMDLSGSREVRLRDAVERLLARRTPRALPEQVLARPDERTPFLEQLTAELTVGETFFFRNEHHFRALKEQVFPSILKENASEREVRIWTAGCATGEEPYSLAIVLDQLLEGKGDWRVSILATDLNPTFLDRARQGRYRPWSFRQTTIHQDRHYFTPDQEWLVLAPTVRDRVRFNYLNLVKDVYPSPLTGTLGLDLILFRNVAIYLRPEVIRAILERFHEALRPGGWLLLGETEVSLAPAGRFETVALGQTTIFRKPVGETRPETMFSPPAPVLASLWEPQPAAQPMVPSLPDWVPLPAADHAGAGRAHSRSPAPGAVWERVESCLGQGDFAGAEQAIDRVPGTGERAVVRLRYARALLAAAEVSRARAMLDRCLREEPLLIEVQLLRAAFAEETGDLAAAEQAYRRALYIDRGCPLAHFHLALVQQQQGDPDGAVRSLRTTLQLLQGKPVHAAVAYGEGVCNGRLREMVLLLLGESA